MKKTVLIALTLALSGCAYGVDPADAARLLEQEGVTEFALEDPHVFYSNCAKGDNLNTPFTGVKNGRGVAGVICGQYNLFGSGAAKGMTIRYF